MKLFIIFLWILILICGLSTIDYRLVYAQEKLEVDGNLKIESTASDQRHGLNLKPLSSTTTPSAPPSPAAKGQIYYNDTDNKPYYYDGTGWQVMSGSTGDKTVASRIVAASNSQGTTGCPGACANPRADSVCSGTQATGGDEVIINAAIDALSTTGGVVYLLEGNYWITDMIKVRSNVAIIGTGAGTVISPKNSATLSNNGVITNYDTTNGNTNILLQNFRIDGNKANNTNKQMGISFTKVNYSKIDNMWVENMKDNVIPNPPTYAGINLKSSNNNIISGNIVQSNDAYGINIYGVSAATSSNNNIVTGNICRSNMIGIGFTMGQYMSNNIIVGNNIGSNIAQGISFIALNTSNNNISGNVIQSNGGPAIYVSIGSSPGNIFSNNIIANNGSGINFQAGITVDKTLISNNIIALNKRGGIDITSGSSNISGNIIYDNGEAGNYDGIKIATGNNNFISSNRIYDSSGTGFGINITSGANNYLTGNLIDGAGFTQPINDLGTTTKYTQKEKITIERQTPVVPTAGSTLDVSTNPKSYVPLAPTSPVTLNAATAIADGKVIGDILILEGGTNTVTILNNANVKLSTAPGGSAESSGGLQAVLGLEYTLKLLWNGTDWIEIGYSNN